MAYVDALINTSLWTGLGVVILFWIFCAVIDFYLKNTKLVVVIALIFIPVFTLIIATISWRGQNGLML